MRVETVRPDDLHEILINHDRFWNVRDLTPLHLPLFVRQFADTSFVVRRPLGSVSPDTVDKRAGEIIGYLFGCYCSTTREGYIHLVATRDDARRAGVARRLYTAFTDTVLQRGATALTCITTPENQGSLAFHHRMGFTSTLVPDYSGPGKPRIVFHRSLTDGPAVIVPARPTDAGEILTVQYAASSCEARVYGDPHLPPLVETLDDVRVAIEAHTVLKAVRDGRIVGAIRVTRHGDTAEISRLVVAPDHQRRGIGSALLAAAERHLTEVRRYALCAGHRSTGHLRLYHRHGYLETHRVTVTPQLTLVYLSKDAPAR